MSCFLLLIMILLRTNDDEQFVSCKEEKTITSKGSYSFTNFVTVVVVMLFVSENEY